MKPILNIAGYKFLRLENLVSIREKFIDQCKLCHLKGTILLAEEGINIMLAGEAKKIKSFINWLSQDARFNDIEFKISLSDRIPFKRLLIKIKKHIIAFSKDINPAVKTARHLTSELFKNWLDNQKTMIVLDVRNKCEVDCGTFENAIDLSLRNFRDFSKGAENLSVFKKQPIVMFCTGGIRCEKAGAYLMEQGFEQVYQLQGGILQYFADCGNAHFQGKCFVFDERGAITPEDLRFL
jgi:UPF0176 protein